jgi:hypothetical protein
MLFSAGESGDVAATGVCEKATALRLNKKSATRFFIIVLDSDQKAWPPPASDSGHRVNYG